MNDLSVYQKLKPIDGVALNLQISRFLRQAIYSNDLPAGLKLPSVRELAKVWDTSIFTIQCALAPLMEDGLIVSRPRIGAFITERKKDLKYVGIYCNHTMRWASDDMFCSMLTSMLFRKFAEKGVNVLTLFDPRPDEEQTEPFQPLMEAIEFRQIQAVAVVDSTKHNRPWLEKLPIAKTLLSGRPRENAVRVESQDYAILAVRRFAELGCESIGLISNASQNLASTFISEAKTLGLATKPEWIIITEAIGNLESLGFGMFDALWDQDEHPDGLLVFPDVLAKGVVQNMLARKLHIPDKLKVILHQNKEAPHFAPFPFDVIQVSIEECAEAVIGALEQALDGSSPVVTVLPRLIANN